MNSRVTLKDIAAACGCTTMSVSYAMRGIGKISPALRNRIRETAQRLGYSPDPLLTALVSYRKNYRGGPVATPLAWVSNLSLDDPWTATYNFVRCYHEAAVARAAELGYRLEYFWLGEPGMTTTRMSQILYARGIKGLLIAPRPRARAHLNLDWEKFSSVTFGYSLSRPRLHRVATHFSALTVSLIRKLRSLGYRRIGLFLDPYHDARLDHNYVAPFLFEQSRFPEQDRIPPLFHPTMEFLPGWIRKHRPDCIVTDDGGVVEWLGKQGFRIPEQLGVAHLQSEAHNGLSGMDHNFNDVGVAAIDQLVGLIQRGERGVPAIPHNLLIEGSWRAGKTVRRLASVEEEPPPQTKNQPTRRSRRAA